MLRTKTPTRRLAIFSLFVVLAYAGTTWAQGEILRQLLPQAVNPGANSSVTVYDSGDPTTRTQGSTRWKRCRVAFYTNVADAVYKSEWLARGSTTWRTVESANVAATTWFQRDALIQPGRSRIRIVTVTAPTTWEVEAELIYEQALAQ